MLEGGEASFEYVVRDLIWSRGLVWCQFVKGPFYLCYCDVEICFHRFRVVCIWDVTKVCWWWRWEEGSTQCGRFLFIGCCFTFQCRDVGIGECGVEVLINLPDAAVIPLANKLLSCFIFTFIHFALVNFSEFLPLPFKFLCSISVESFPGPLCLLS